MQGTILYGLGDVRFEERKVPRITKPTDAMLRLGEVRQMLLRHVGLPSIECLVREKAPS